MHLIVRSEKLRASAAMVDRVKANPKIEIHWNTKVDKADGSEWLEKIETIHSQEGKEGNQYKRSFLRDRAHTKYEVLRQQN